MALQSLDITWQRSATTTPSPQVRQTPEVAKLIDESKCIGCKACQVACMNWNDLRDEVGTNGGLRQPDRPDGKLVDRDEVLRGRKNRASLEWLIRKDGCMHCSDPGCLKACPAPGRHRQVRQRHRRLPSGRTASAAATA
jgi:formate dehydrogenase iron-sulfur subunit